MNNDNLVAVSLLLHKYCLCLMKLHYHDYLQLEKILNAQFPESDKQQLACT